MDESEPIGIKASAALASIPQEQLMPEPPPSPHLYESVEEMEARWRIIHQRKAEDNRKVLLAFQEEQRQTKLEAHKRLGTILTSTLNQIEDRLDKGDPVIDATGQLVGHRPQRLRDLDNLAGMVIDRQIAIEKRITGEQDGATHGEVPKSVTDLLERLELLAKANPIHGKVAGEYRNPVIDVIPEAGD